MTEVLGRNQGPTKLNRCKIDNFDLADGLRGNNRLKSLILRLSNNLEEVLTIAGALEENKGLVVSQWRTVPWFWDEPFSLPVPIQIALGCYYRGIRKLPFLDDYEPPCGWYCLYYCKCCCCRYGYRYSGCFYNWCLCC
jgi:hypothetical protein